MTAQASAERASHPTRTVLLDAGLRIAARHGLTQMTVDRVVAEANVAKGTYYVHFDSRKAYLVALYNRWHQILLGGIYRAIDGKAPGPDRLRVATDAYMDACLAAQSIQAVLVAARSEPAISDAARKATAEAAAILTADFAVLGFSHPEKAAHLFVSATISAALVELDQGFRSPDIRESLQQFALGPGVTPR